MTPLRVPGKSVRYPNISKSGPNLVMTSAWGEVFADTFKRLEPALMIPKHLLNNFPISPQANDPSRGAREVGEIPNISKS